jgi:NAD(P)-dependent dehydrogenase (short-subunit alcohol dehydrogenase family)
MFLQPRQRRAGSKLRANVGNRQARTRIGPEVARLDLADLGSVKEFAAAWKGLLVNNARVKAIPELKRSPKGWEIQFATNHMGHFALSLAMHDAPAKDEAARVVSLSSSAHQQLPRDICGGRLPADNRSDGRGAVRAGCRECGAALGGVITRAEWKVKSGRLTSIGKPAAPPLQPWLF